jgi:hypothetical protein
MSTKIVGDGLIEQATLYRPVFWLLRLDVLPFVCLYGIFFACALSKIQPLVYAGLIALPILFALHLFLFLMAQWSVKVRCMLGYTLVSDIKAAQIVRVMAAQNAGADRLARLAVNSNLPDTVSVNILGKAYAITKERLDFQKVTYNFDADRNNFVRLEYPTSVPVKTMLDWRGHPSTQSVGLSLLRWGTNEYDIPIPNFLDLYLVSLYVTWYSCRCMLAICRNLNCNVPWITAFVTQRFEELSHFESFHFILGPPGCPVLCFPSAVPVPVESGRLLVLQRLHAADAHVLRR